MSTSISDTDAYREICRQAAGDPAVFRSFKRDPRYQLVLEHVTPEQGAAYMLSVLERAPALGTLLDRFRANDRLGDPLTHDYGPGIGSLSPTTCRYLKVLCDLLSRFGDLDGLRIVEVGGGYGGQCFAIHAVARPASYTILDLAEPLALQGRYLAELGVQAGAGGVSFLTMDALPSSLPCDLFISNYALTECARPITDVYLDRVVMAAVRGYVTGNRIGSDCYTRDELLQRLPFADAIEEVPRTAMENYLLVWDRSGAASPPHPLVPRGV